MEPDDTPKKPNERMANALRLMKSANWLEEGHIDDFFIGMKMTPYGQNQAETFFRIFLELRCGSLEELEDVLTALAWYLNRDDLN